MQRRAALIALLGGAATIALIILLSGGRSDEQPSSVASGPSEEKGEARSGASGTAGSGGSDSGAAPVGPAERRARERAARREARVKRAPRSQEQGRLGPQTGGSPAQGERPARQRTGATVATIDVVGGAPVGGVQRVRFAKDDRVRVIVRSDTDEVVEIPGYGLTRRVSAGGSARFYFETSKEGLFEIELTRGQTRIGVLAVG